VWFDQRGALQQGLTWQATFIAQGSITLSIEQGNTLEQDKYTVLAIDDYSLLK
jgi:hypothetical protein